MLVSHWSERPSCLKLPNHFGTPRAKVLMHMPVRGRQHQYIGKMQVLTPVTEFGSGITRARNYHPYSSY